jgi:lysophospholipase L1-like esterase
MRNSVFGITPGSTRKVIPGRYRDNLAALQAILDRSRREHIRVVMYIVPLRGGVKIPYDNAEYTAFKSEMETLAQQYSASFKNLEQLIPDDFWGTKASTSLSEEQELDFMHFRYSGHSLLAQALHALVVKALAKRQAESLP